MRGLKPGAQQVALPDGQRRRREQLALPQDQPWEDQLRLLLPSLPVLGQRPEVPGVMREF